MQAGTKPEQVTDREVRWFGVVMWAALGLVAAWLWVHAYRAGESAGVLPWVLVAVGGVICLGASAAPKQMRPVYRGWMFIGLAIGTVVNTVLLCVMYYTCFTVIGLLRRWVRGDVLQRQFDPDAETYWIERDPHPAKARYRRQF